MPLGDVVVGVAGGLLRLVGYLFLEIFIEFLIRGPGKLICRLLGRRVALDGLAASVIGILFWCVLGAIAYGLFLLTAHPTL